MYVWCQLNRDTVVTFWFGSQFKAIYLPWVLVGFNFIIKGGGFLELLGIAVGHLYCVFKYPQNYSRTMLVITDLTIIVKVTLLAIIWFLRYIIILERFSMVFYHHIIIIITIIIGSGFF